MQFVNEVLFWDGFIFSAALTSVPYVSTCKSALSYIDPGELWGRRGP